jgi:hypothetical protein
VQIGAVLWGKSIIRENACNDLAHERKLRSKRKVRTEERLKDEVLMEK